MTTVAGNQMLSLGLNKVGLKPSESIEIEPETIASTWTSEYAELYVVDAADRDLATMPELLNKLDGVVAKRLRAQRDAGKFIDAHVCIIVADVALQGGQLTKESEASRYVSRKYWIDRKAPIDEILKRVTLTWVDVDATKATAPPLFPSEFADLRNRIATRMGAGAATDFLDAEAI